MPRRAAERSAWSALAVFCASLSITALLAMYQGVVNERRAAERFTQSGQDLKRRISERMYRYQYGLRGARGAIMTAGTDRLTRQAFRAYHESRDLPVEFAGARGFGFIRRVAQADEEAYVRRIRREGFPEFSVHQLAPHDGDRYFIQFVEPEESNRAAAGLDIASESRRKDAADRAMRTGEVSLTAPITLVQATGQRSQGFLVLLPIYVHGEDVRTEAARLQHGQGWAYAPLVISEVLADFELGKADYVLTLTDVTDARDPVVFHSTERSQRPDLRSPWRFRATTNVFGRVWQMDMVPTPAFVSGLHLVQPRWVMFGGGLASALLAMLVYVQVLGRFRQRMIRSQQLRLATIVESASDAIISQSLDGVVESWNAAAEKIIGYAASEALGQPISSLMRGMALAEHEDDIRRAILQGRTVHAFDTVCEGKDGRMIDVSVSASPILSPGGAVVGIGKTIRDISDKKAAERQLREFNGRLEQQVQQRTAELAAAHRHLQAVLDGLPSMVGYWDKNQINRFANKAYGQWFGVDPASLPGNSLRSLLGDNLYQRNLPFIEAALRGEPQTFERTIPCPDRPGVRHALSHYIPDVVDGEVRGFHVLVHDVTELTESRQKLDAAMRESEALLRTIQEHSIYSVADRHGRIVDVNEAFCRISGYTREELIGQNHRIVNSATHDRAFWVAMWRALASGKSWHGEICNRAKDGTLYWVDSIIAPFIGHDGRIEKYVSLRTDVTDRVKATEALDQERERLDNILQGTNVGTWEWHIQTGETRFNERWAQIVGYTLDELQPVNIQTWVRFTHPDDLRRSNEALQLHFEGKTPSYECEARMRHKDGHWVWVLDRGKVLRWDDEGRPLWMAGTHMDITERKYAQEKLRATSEAFIERAGRVAGVGGWQFDLSTGEAILTGQTRRIHELGDNQSLNLEDAVQFYAPEARATIREAVLAAIQRGQGWDLELPFCTAKGRHIWVRSVGEPEYDEEEDPGGRPARLIGALQDVTAKHEADDALREAMRAAEAASLAKSEFLANMSHEIRTPLNAVIGLAYLMRSSHLDPEQLQFVQKIQNASASLLAIVNDVLDLSKIEAGELRAEVAPFQIMPLLDSLDQLFHLQFDSKGLAFHIQAPDLVPEPVWGDVTRLRQVLVNLLGNALKFTEQGSVALILTLEAQHADHVLTRWAVKDTGIGIPSDVIPSLFTPFMQADASTTRRFGGTGLGLSIVQRLVVLMGGEVGVDSVEDQGSTFWFTVPLALSGDRPDVVDMPERLMVRDEPNLCQLPDVRVLIVDDSDINLEVAQRLLSREGALPTLARNGAQALAILREQPQGFDVVLMDVQMPVMDGHEATRRLRTELGLHDLPVIALTAGALVSERQRAIDAGMNAFVSKPLDPHLLIGTVRQHVERLRGAALAPVARHSQPAVAGETWPHLEGIDEVDVIERIGGDLNLFASMLARLFDEYRDVAEGQLTVPAGDDDRGAIAARVHKLRGSAGMLGAHEVQSQAEQLELALRQEGGPLPPATAFEHLSATLRRLHDACQPWLEAMAQRQQRREAVEAPSTVLDENALREWAAQLDRQDLSALERFHALAGGLRQQMDAAAFESLKQAVQGLAFKEARAVLDEAGLL